MTDPKQAQSSDLVFGGDASAEAESDVAQRFAFSRLEEDDLEMLAGLRPLFESCADEFIEAPEARLQNLLHTAEPE